MCNKKYYKDVQTDFIYNEDYTTREMQKRFNPIPNKRVIHFQLTFTCYDEKDPENYFSVYFNYFTQVELVNSDLKKARHPCQVRWFGNKYAVITEGDVLQHCTPEWKEESY